MNSVEIMSIIKKYKSNEIDFATASLLLIITGLKPEEVKDLLNDSSIEETLTK